MVNPTLNRLVFIFSLIGAVLAGYLWYMHAHPADIPCGGSGGCEDVANSPYSRFPIGFGPPVAAYGTLGYLILATLSFLRTIPGTMARERRLLILTLLVAGFGLVASLYLTFAEVFWIHAICRWCVGSQMIMLLLFGVVLASWLQYAKHVKQEARSAS